MTYVAETAYDKRNVEGLEGQRDHSGRTDEAGAPDFLPDAEVRVKPMQANCLNSDTNKSGFQKI